MKPQDVLDYYSNPNIASQIAAAAQYREAVGAYSDGRYDSRPSVVQYPKDVVQLAARGITSFHISVERWSFPMQLSTDKPESYDRLRTGWDLLIDIDSKLEWKDSGIAALLVCEVLEKYGVDNYGLKFSGRRGFHIIVPAEAFPKEIDYKPIASVYPNVPRIVVGFIRDRISEKLMQELTARHTFKELLSKLDSPPSSLNPYLFVEVEKEWGVRHLFRAPYSFNEKTWLVSLPISKQQMKAFDPSMANPSNVSALPKLEGFIKSASGEAERLVRAALDWHAIQTAETPRKAVPVRQYDGVKEKIPEQYFPPCIKLILGGLKDGRKRSVFTLITFLRNVGWACDEAEARIAEWNGKNLPPLPVNYVNGQLRWHKVQTRKISPPKCAHEQFLASISLCQPDSVCKSNGDKVTLKNPAGYPHRAMPELRAARKNAKGIKDDAGNVLSCSGCDKKFKSWKILYSHKSRAH